MNVRGTMNRHVIHLLLIVASFSIAEVSLAQVAPGSTVATSDSDIDRARVLYKKAQVAFEAERYDEARQLLLQVWQIRQTTDTAAELGHTEMELRRYRDAAEHFDYCLRNYPPTGNRKLLQSIQDSLAEARTHVGQLKIMTNRDGAEVQVDGHSVGQSPLQSVVYVEPGRREIHVQQGDSAESQVFDVAAGKATEAFIELRQPNAPPLTSSSSPLLTAATPFNAQTSTPVRETPKRSMVPVIVGGAVFAVGLGTAIGFRLTANSKDSDAKALLQSIGAGGCRAPTSRTADCATLLEAAQSGDRYANWSTVGFSVAGAALVATATYWLWPRTEMVDAERKSANLHFSVAASASNSEVWVTGDF